MPPSKKIKTAEELYKHFVAYKTYCKNNPKTENYWSTKQDKQISVSREIPLTWDGFDIYLRLNKILSRLSDYKANKDKRYDVFAYIIRAIEQEIYNDKYCGAAVGIYQHNIIARDLGLADSQKIDQTITDNRVKIVVTSNTEADRVASLN